MALFSDDLPWISPNCPNCGAKPGECEDSSKCCIANARAREKQTSELLGAAKAAGEHYDRMRDKAVLEAIAGLAPPANSLTVTVTGDIQTTTGVHPSERHFHRDNMTPEQAIHSVIEEVCHFQGVNMYVTGPIFTCLGVTRVYGG